MRQQKAAQVFSRSQEQVYYLLSVQMINDKEAGLHISYLILKSDELYDGILLRVMVLSA
jgi:hypothetical protein